MQVTGTDAVLARLNEAPAKIRAAAKVSLDAWAKELAGYIKMTKLSGNPLHRRSGNLSASIVPISQETADTVSGGAGGGRDIPYAKIHEYGGQINHPGGTAYMFIQGRVQFVSNVVALSKSWLPRTGPHVISIPERSYMLSSLREEAPEGIAQLKAAVREALLA